MTTPNGMDIPLIMDRVKSHSPQSPGELWNFIKVFYGLAVPRKSICPEHDAPFDYVAASFLGQAPGETQNSGPACRDLVVWACRGGGKTELGSVTTHLDSIFRPGCQTRILGGSLEQSEKMYNYLSRKWHPHFADLLASEPTRRRTALANGSMVEVLTQSNRSVRGQRVHRLRCDELDEFDPDVWQAAQFVTQSSEGIRARMEVFSTLHRPWGLMQKIVDELAGGAITAERHTSAEASAAKLFKWCLWEVIERCPPERSCSRCPLSPDCGGKARDATGYLQIDDAIAQMRRSSTAAWRSEMLCQRPRSEDLVFAEFQPAVHVSDVAYDAALPLYRAVDFGYANPFVCLWLQVRPASDGDGQEHVRVIGEYVERRRTIAEHLKALRDAEPGPVASTFADPAGWARNDVTGTGPCQELAAMGERVRTRRSGILEGVEIIRRLLAPAACVPGQRPGLVIDRRCPTLIKALETYHFRPVGKTTAGGGRWQDVPEKDGVSDHPIDALRYGLVNLLGTSARPLKEGKYW